MSGQTHRDEVTKRLLLGELSDEEQIGLEERFFEDDSVFEELKIAQEELIERYLDNRLDARDRANFEHRLASSSRFRERVIFAKILADKADRVAPLVQPAPVPLPAPTWSDRLFGSAIFQRPAFRMAFVAALMIVVLGSVAWFVRKSQLDADIEAKRNLERQQQELQQQRNQSGQTVVEVSQTPTPAPVPTETIPKAVDSAKIALITLTSGGSRSTGSSGNKLTLDSSKEKVRLTLIVDDTSYERYNVLFSGTQTRFQKEGRLRKSTDQLVVEVPAVQLPPDDYKIRVDGILSNGTEEPVSDYTLSVRRK